MSAFAAYRFPLQLLAPVTRVWRIHHCLSRPPSRMLRSIALPLARLPIESLCGTASFPGSPDRPAPGNLSPSAVFRRRPSKFLSRPRPLNGAQCFSRPRSNWRNYSLPISPLCTRSRRHPRISISKSPSILTGRWTKARPPKACHRGHHCPQLLSPRRGLLLRAWQRRTRMRLVQPLAVRP